MSKAQAALGAAERSFADECRAQGLRHAALLEPRGGVYRAVFCHGLDALSLAASVSSADFWDGLLGGSRQKFFSREDAAALGFIQLFSGEMKARFQSASAARIGGSVLLAASLEGETDARLRGESAMRAFARFANAQKKNFDARQCEALGVFFGDAVDESVSLAGLESGVAQDLKAALAADISDRLSRALQATGGAPLHGGARLSSLARFHIKKCLEGALGKSARLVSFGKE